ncbi:MAG: hypothetical protein ACRDP3_09060, partial [Streptomyces sp.]
MRYPQGGGLYAERQLFREELRLQAAERFARGEASSVTAKEDNLCPVATHHSGPVSAATLTGP